jgi:PAS domain S-box-containing protein
MNVHSFGKSLFMLPRWVEPVIVCLLCVGAAAIGRWLLGPWVGEKARFLLFILALIPPAILYGFSAGILATVLSLCAAVSIFVYKMALPVTPLHVSDQIQVVTFFIGGVGIAALGEMVRSTRKRQEAALKTAEGIAKELADFKYALDASSIVAVTDPRGRITYVNDKFCEISKYSREELLGKDHRIVNSGHHSKEFFREMWGTITAGRSWQGEIKNRAKDGSYYWVLTNIIPFLDRNGKPYQFVAIRQDITDRKGAEEEFKRLRAVAEAASQAKTEFLANMSHEIRTPMNAILGYSELLLDPEMSESDRANFVARIRSNGAQLMQIIDDILNLSKFEAGRLPIEKHRVPVVDLVYDVVDSLRPMGEAKGLNIQIQFMTAVPREICTDSMRLRQILTNVIGNALKFTDQGGVDVRLSLIEKNLAGEGPWLGIEVEDTGLGISREEQERLFQPFAQADASITRRFGGTGLGLVLSRRFACALGGDLRLTRSTPGKGSCFSLSIETGDISGVPLLDSTGPSPIRVGPVRESGKRHRELEDVRVLLAEDSPDNAALVRLYLELEGAKVDWVKDGVDAVTFATRNDYALVLMDVQMPRLDGLQATRELIKRGYRKPIVALTAHAMREEVARSLEAGCVAHLTKPMQRHGLVTAIKGILHGPVKQEARVFVR